MLNLDGWLTTVVARVCLDMLRARSVRQEESLDAPDGEALEIGDGGNTPEQEAVLAESVGLALFVVLEALSPLERLAFVLHDIFSVSFEEIAPIVGRTPTAARQLASRARRRVRGATQTLEVDQTRQREVVGAFLAAARGGDFEGLVALLDPEAVLRADAAAVQMGAPTDMRGAAVATFFAGRAHAARLALLQGAVGAVWAQSGTVRVAFSFTIRQGKIAAIELIADPERLGQLNVTFLKGLRRDEGTRPQS